MESVASLTEQQLGIYIHCVSAGVRRLYQGHFAFHLKGGFTCAHVEFCWDDLIASHKLLSASLHMEMPSALVWPKGKTPSDMFSILQWGIMIQDIDCEVLHRFVIREDFID
jgi:hypothetical protein